MLPGKAGYYLFQLAELCFEAYQQILISTTTLQHSSVFLDGWQVELLIQTAKCRIADSPKLNLCNKICCEVELMFEVLLLAQALYTSLVRQHGVIKEPLLADKSCHLKDLPTIEVIVTCTSILGHS